MLVLYLFEDQSLMMVVSPVAPAVVSKTNRSLALLWTTSEQMEISFFYGNDRTMTRDRNFSTHVCLNGWPPPRHRHLTKNYFSIKEMCRDVILSRYCHRVIFQ